MELLAPTRRWLAGLLGMAYLFDVVVNIGSGVPAEALVPVPLLAFTLVALARPVLGVAGGALWLVGVSVVALATGVGISSRVGVEGFLLSETVAIGALAAIAAWRSRAGNAVALVGLLATGGAVAALLRQLALNYDPDIAFAEVVLSVLSGAVVVVGGCLVGYALRAHEERGSLTKAGDLIRRQWPLALALAVLNLVDLTSTARQLAGFSLVYIALFLLIAGTAVCAVLSPTAPLRYAVIATVAMLAATISLTPMIFIFGYDDQFPVPISIAGAHMALVVYLVRHASRTDAAVGIAALAGVDVISVVSVVGVVGMRREFLLIAAFLLVVSMATGQYFRSRDRERAQTVRVAVTGAQQAERMALARELHDVVAHHVTGIVVAAQAAQLVGDANPTAAVHALGRIEAAGGEALAAMRMLVGSMRGAPVAGAEGQATMDLAADLRSLVDNFHGPEIDMSLDLPVSLPPEAGRSVLRIVQEALTNVGKHARDAHLVTITIGVVDDELRLRVADDATRVEMRPPGGSGGYGLVGMRERIDLLGGRFTAGPGDPNGWVVDAGFPLRTDRKGSA
ncbi:sensor histidine kinase [Actinokineospora cianjurensis]|uniref:histidine kinase n=1 Tax=Actinokineospora cianjurensis TaxID=585224 RepID=A0A421B729_9PSEU|nr:histidine kinase [Actinokineospora cianjurensis]RLK60085.1 signal transduction histidine kinase [Actinokineospora cianjurensis]